MSGWRADEDQQKRRTEIGLDLGDALESAITQMVSPFKPWPPTNWEVEAVPEGTDEDLAPLIWVHKPTGQRFLVEGHIEVTSLPPREYELAAAERKAQLEAGQLELETT